MLEKLTLVSARRIHKAIFSLSDGTYLTTTAKKCWTYLMKQTKGAYCTTCDNVESKRFFSKNIMYISPEDVRDYFGACKDYFEASQKLLSYAENIYH